MGSAPARRSVAASGQPGGQCVPTVCRGLVDVQPIAATRAVDNWLQAQAESNSNGLPADRQPAGLGGSAAETQARRKARFLPCVFWQVPYGR